MRILFIARRYSYLKNFEGPILELARRGHTLNLVALGGEGKIDGSVLVERWAAQQPNIRFQRIPVAVHEELKVGLRNSVSMMVDYVRYLDPAYRTADGLVERARRRTPIGFLRLIDKPIFRSAAAQRVLMSLLRRLEAASPHSHELDAFFQSEQPDVVLFTPLIGLQSGEQDMLAAAAERGLRTVFGVLSWDNLSSKAIIRTLPDLVMVWNDVQADEARRLHAVPDERIAVTGAQTFDHWFGRGPSKPREAFLQRVGLPADRPFLLWVCSSLFRTSPVEARFVRKWIEAIRHSSDPQLRDAAILVRPHPSRMAEWARVPLDDLGPVSLWGSTPVDQESRDDYFDSLYYSAAVVGLNTSAFLEAAIIGKPVYTILLPEYHDSQEGTLHFPYLLNVAGGLLHTSRDMPSHMAQLATALRQPPEATERSRRFVEAFIRPRGIDTNASQEFVAALERLMQRPAHPARLPKAGVLARAVYRWIEERGRQGTLQAWLTSLNEISHRNAREAKLAAAEAARAARQQKQAHKAERRREKEAARLAAATVAAAERRRGADEAEAALLAERSRRKAEERHRKALALQEHRAAKRQRREKEALEARTQDTPQ